MLFRFVSSSRSPLVLGQVVSRPDDRDPGVVDENVDAAELDDRCLEPWPRPTVPE